MPGHKAGYHTVTSWYILGEIVARLSGISYATNYVREKIFLPLSMNLVQLEIAPRAKSPRNAMFANRGGGYAAR